MSEEIKFDHFKDIKELLEHINLWYKEDDIEYTRWFGLEDLYNLKIYITSLQQKVEQLEKENKELKYDCSCSFHDAEELNQKLTETIDERNELDTKLIQLENIRKEAIDYVYKHIQEYDIDGTFTNLDEFDFIASPQVLLNILNKGDNKE